jgi:hypothetical protein
MGEGRLMLAEEALKRTDGYCITGCELPSLIEF